MRGRSPMRGAALLVGLLAALLLVVAPSAADAGEALRSPNEQFNEIEEQVPGFGGAFLKGDPRVDDEVELHIWMVDHDDEAVREVQALLVDSFFGPDLDRERVVVHQGTYTATQLDEWHLHLSETLLVEVGYSGVREQINRVVVGLPHPERDSPAVRAHLDELGIPQDAVVIELGGPMVPAIGTIPWWARSELNLLLVSVAVAGAGWLAIRRRWRTRAADGPSSD